MKKLGFVGGISWVSTIDYYRYINEGINERLGGLNFAECIIYSLNFDDFQRSNTAGNWDGTFELIYAACENLKKVERKQLFYAPIRLTQFPKELRKNSVTYHSHCNCNGK